MSFSARGFFSGGTSDESSVAQTGQDSRWVLHILNGPQSQVQAPLSFGRHLIGNDPASCDLIMETGDDSRQLAIVWVSPQSVSLSVVRGEAWRGSDPYPENVYQDLFGGEVLTLGRVSFVVAPADFDFSVMQPPAVLNRPESPLGEAAVPMPIRSRITRGLSKAIRSGAMLSSAVALAITLLWASGFATAGRDAHQRTQLDLAQLQQQAASLGLEEVRFEHQGDPSTLIATGYVANPAVYATLERRLADLPKPGVVRVTRVDQLLRALSDDARLKQAYKLSYLGTGQFAAEVVADDYAAYREIASQAFRDHAGIQSVSIAVSDIISDDRRATALVTMSRLPGSLGRIATSGDSLPLIAGADEIGRYSEVRLGKMPSIVTSSGRRLFEGSVLYDGSVIEKIDAHQIQVVRSGFRRALVVQGNTVSTTQVAKPPVNNFEKSMPALGRPDDGVAPLVMKTESDYY